MGLTIIALQNAKPTEKAFKLHDTAGLYALVAPSGSKLWRFDYSFEGKRRTLALGKWPDVSLVAARERRDAAKQKLADGRDPSDTRNLPTGSTMTFREAATHWFQNRKGQWEVSYSSRIWNRLHDDIFPPLGSKAVDRIEPTEVLKAIRAIEERGAIELAKRVKNYCSDVFALSIAEGWCEHNPAADITKALKPSPKKKRRAFIRAHLLPDFREKFAAAVDLEPVTRLALKFTILTALRTNEVRFAQKDDFEDLDGPEPMIRIPGDRMKVKEVPEHLVPLSRQAVAVVKEALERFPDGALLFPSGGGRAISQNTMLFALYGMGYHSKATVHGFRTTFSTAANEARAGGRRQWSSDAIERQLAHVEQNEVRASYNAAEYMDERRELMQWWADLCWPEPAVVAEPEPVFEVDELERMFA